MTGAGSKWNNPGNLFVGDNGPGTLNIEAGGFVIVGHTTTIGPFGAVHLNGGTISTSSTVNNGGEFSASVPAVMGGDFVHNGNVHCPPARSPPVR